MNEHDLNELAAKMIKRDQEDAELARAYQDVAKNLRMMYEALLFEGFDPWEARSMAMQHLIAMSSPTRGDCHG